MQVLIFCELGLKMPSRAPKIGIFGPKYGKERCNFNPQWTRSYFGVVNLSAIFGENRPRNATVRVRTDRWTDTLWQRQTEFIVCPMLYGIAMGQIKTEAKLSF